MEEGYMEKKFAFVIDSTLTAGTEDATVEDLFILPLYTVVDNVSYKDVEELSISAFYDKLTPTTEVSSSQPSVGDFLELYEKLVKQGYTTIFVFTLSSGISGTSQTAGIAGEMLEGATVHVIDTGICGAPGSLVVQDVIEFAKTTDDEMEIIAYANELLENVDIILYIGDLTSLKNGGRLSHAAAFLGNLLQIKPIIRVQNKILDVVAKERTQKRGIKKAVEIVHDREIEEVIFLHTNMEEPKNEIIRAFQEKYPNIPSRECGISPVIGVHTGTNASGIALRYKKR